MSRKTNRPNGQEKLSLKELDEGQLSDMLTAKYGDWDFQTLPANDPIVIEFFNRISRGM